MQNLRVQREREGGRFVGIANPATCFDVPAATSMRKEFCNLKKKKNLTSYTKLGQKNSPKASCQVAVARDDRVFFILFAACPADMA